MPIRVNHKLIFQCTDHDIEACKEKSEKSVAF